MTIERHKVGARMSQTVAHGSTVCLAGQVADTPSADVRQQTQEVPREIDELLAAAGIALMKPMLERLSAAPEFGSTSCALPKRSITHTNWSPERGR